MFPCDVRSAPHQQPAFASKALEVLATLPVKGRAPKTGYSREQFGPAWSDVDHNGCDTRNDMLRRDLTALALRPGTRDCVVLSGVLADPYTATAINFLRGNATSTAVQIDHVVALSDAWQKGAQQLSPAQRLSFANDPLNLLAVDGPANQSKSDGDAATWLPPNKSYRCNYVARQISVKSSYGLWVTQAEHDAMARVLSDCPDALAPTNQPASAPAQAAQAPPAQQPAPAQVRGPRASPGPGPDGARTSTSGSYLRELHRGPRRRRGAHPRRPAGVQRQAGPRRGRRRLRVAAAGPASGHCRWGQFLWWSCRSRAQRMKPRCEYAWGWLPRWVSVPGSYSSGSSPVGPNRFTSWSKRSQASSIRPTAM